MRTYSIKYFCLFISTIILSFGSLNAQKKFTEVEIKIQELFIEASKERILGHHDKAIELYAEILNKDDQNHTAAYELARMYILTEDYSKGLEWAEKAVTLSEFQNIWYLLFLAKIYEENAQYESAADTYERIIQIDRETEQHYFQRATLLLKSNKPDKALEVYELAEDKFGVSERLVQLKSTIYRSSGKVKKAEKEWLKLLEAYPDDTRYMAMLALFYEQANRQDAAQEVYEKILKLDPQNVKAKLAIAGKSSAESNDFAYLESLKPVFGQPDVALNTKVKQIIPTINKVADNGETEKALAEKVLELTSILEEVHPQQAQGFAASGDILYSIGAYQRARKKYKEAISRNEAIFSVWEQTMRSEIKLMDFKALYKTTNEAIDIFPNQPVLYYNNGLAAHKLGEDEEALSILDQAELMAEGNEALYTKIKIQKGISSSVLGYDKEFEAAFEDVMKRNPENPTVLITYAYELANKSSRLDDALKMAEDAIKKDKDNVVFKQKLGWIHYKRGEYKKAVSLMEAAVGGGLQRDPIALEQFGDALFQLDQKEEALKYWIKAKDLGRNSSILEKKISDKKLYD